MASSSEEKRKSETATNHCLLRKGKLLIKKLDEQSQKFRYLQVLHEIIESADSKELEDLMIQHKPDLILFETSPERSLLEMSSCESLHKQSRAFNVPIILIAREYSIDCYRLCTKIGAEAYLKESFQWDLLPLVIEHLIRSKEKPHEIRAGGEANDTDHLHNTRFIHKIDQYISENMDDPEFSVAALCDALAMSRSLVYKKLKALKGLSIIEYIRSRKINEAVQLLKSRQYKIYEVAFMVGFSNQKYFRKLFVERFGMPPSKFI